MNLLLRIDSGRNSRDPAGHGSGNNSGHYCGQKGTGAEKDEDRYQPNERTRYGRNKTQSDQRERKGEGEKGRDAPAHRDGVRLGVRETPNVLLLVESYYNMYLCNNSNNNNATFLRKGLWSIVLA